MDASFAEQWNNWKTGEKKQDRVYNDTNQVVTSACQEL